MKKSILLLLFTSCAFAKPKSSAKPSSPKKVLAQSKLVTTSSKPLPDPCFLTNLAMASEAATDTAKASKDTDARWQTETVYLDGRGKQRMGACIATYALKMVSGDSKAEARIKKYLGN